MSVNGLDGISSSARKNDERKSSAPFELQSDRIHDMHEQRHQQSHRSFIPTIHSTVYVTSHVQKNNTYHSAVAAKHIVLPTYIGSRNTLNGNPSTRWSINIPK